MNENKFTCACCGNEYDLDELESTVDGLVCHDCLDDNFVYCERCGTYERYADATEVRIDWRHHEWWCADCVENYAVQCQHCHECVHEDYALQDDFGTQLCSDCYDDYYRTCNDCGRIIHEDDARWDDDDEYAYCHDCYQHLFSDRAIQRYGYKPEPIFGYRRGEDASTALTFGLELEVDDGDEPAEDTAQAVIEAAEGRVYCKHDGSLDSGFEIVSHPGTLAHHTYETRWRAITSICKKAGFRSHDTSTCGLHIHVGRSGLGSDWDERQASGNKLVLLANTLRDELKTFSRRTQETLERWADLPCLNLRPGMSDHELCEQAERFGAYTRYVGINRQNGSTIEFRIFRGTLERDTILASIQLVHNLCRYAMTHTPTECTTCTFRDIVSVQPFGELVAYSIKRNLLPMEEEAA